LTATCGIVPFADRTNLQRSIFRDTQGARGSIEMAVIEMAARKRKEVGTTQQPVTNSYGLSIQDPRGDPLLLIAFATKGEADGAEAALRAVLAKAYLPGRRRLNIGAVEPLPALLAFHPEGP
jgi:hypothetical protein